jgi:uncharacterized damage-inducible protein DinB
MPTTKTYRPGTIGALLDIYEQAISELIKVIEDIPDNNLTITTDPVTADENCRSVQAILSHVVTSGYGYAVQIYNHVGNNSIRPSATVHANTGEYSEDLANVFAYTEHVFEEINEDQLDELDNSLKIKATWGQSYDITQMMEHAILHVLRHKRQIEKVKLGVLQMKIH